MAWTRRRTADVDEAAGSVDPHRSVGSDGSDGSDPWDHIRVRPLGDGDVEAAASLLDATVAGRWQARSGEIHDVLALPGFAAWAGDRMVGVATWSCERPRAELAVLAVDAARRDAGIGGALLEWVAAAARKHGTHALWLVTTNDNLDALRLYQRHAFRLVELRPGAIDAARAVKPEISKVGDHGIPVHDELILERRL